MFPLTLIIKSIFLSALVSAVPEDEPIEYDRFIPFPNFVGKLHVDLQEYPDLDVVRDAASNAANNKYQLFTRRNPDTPQTLFIDNPDSVRSSYFQGERQTIVIVHGWLGNQNSDINPAIRDAFLKQLDVNVIVMDWSRLALSSYVTATAGVPNVGRGLGQFLAYLTTVTNASYSNMHLIGFSLGAHVVGNAGKELGGKVARITGLDPAGPQWNLNSNRFNAFDGVYTEAIHTDAGKYGISTAVADADFFANGGSFQPGCSTDLCNHSRSWQLFASSVTYNHLVGRACSNLIELGRNTCRGAEVRMGNSDLTKGAAGIYRVNTTGKYPY